MKFYLLIFEQLLGDNIYALQFKEQQWYIVIEWRETIAPALSGWLHCHWMERNNCASIVWLVLAVGLDRSTLSQPLDVTRSISHWQMKWNCLSYSLLMMDSLFQHRKHIGIIFSSTMQKKLCIDIRIEMTSDARQLRENGLRQTLNVRVASNKQKIQSSGWP